MAAMKRLFSKVLLAQVVTVVLALLIMAGITRAALTRGFVNFLQKQEMELLA